MATTNSETVKMTFKDAPVGARFEFCGKIWVKLNSYPKGILDDGMGLIVQWKGNVEGYQERCCWVDEEHGIDYNTIIELL